mmetsp:Transcript_32711/g.90309  ORF Transcript_32711/g.90309 Transcript_32711/m.90309 type:complete len:270 (-) Transcript_32711:2-811(-)
MGAVLQVPGLAHGADLGRVLRRLPLAQVHSQSAVEPTHVDARALLLPPGVLVGHVAAEASRLPGHAGVLAGAPSDLVPRAVLLHAGLLRLLDRARVLVVLFRELVLAAARLVGVVDRLAVVHHVIQTLGHRGHDALAVAGVDVAPPLRAPACSLAGALSLEAVERVAAIVPGRAVAAHVRRVFGRSGVADVHIQRALHVAYADARALWVAVGHAAGAACRGQPVPRGSVALAPGLSQPEQQGAQGEPHCGHFAGEGKASGRPPEAGRNA